MTTLQVRAGFSALLLAPCLACNQLPAGEVGDPATSPPVTMTAPAAPGSPLVAISEIMYHPVLENDDQENHEFIELHNAADKPVALEGWRLRIGGREAFTFGEGAEIAPRAYLVLAKDQTKLRATHGLADGVVAGGFAGALDNGGDTVALVDQTGALVDVVRYDDQFPWPIGADALGASQAWFPAGELEKHQYKGRSLERVSFVLPGSEVRNWEASPTGGGTPGQANASSGEPAAMVLDISPRGTVVGKGEQVTVKLTVSAGALRDLAVEYFVDDLARAEDTEERMRVAMMPTTGQAQSYTARLPALPERSLVRYRIVGQRQSGLTEVISPRLTDPYGFHLYFVSPEKPVAATAYQIFIAPAAWTRMWTHLGMGPNLVCELNPTWDARVPAVVVRNGRAQDVLVRYQGSRYQRWNGFELPPFPAGTGPAQPSDFKALSWRLSFPNYDRWVEGKDDRRETITLNKQFQACPGVLNHLASKLYWAAGVPTQRFRFARMYVNGSYYHYMMEVEDIDEDLLAQAEPAGGAVGNLFKSDGALDDQGSWGRGNFRPLQPNPTCPSRWSKAERYRYTYERQSHEWKDATPAGHAGLIEIIETLAPLYQAAKTSGNWQPVRDHLSQHFDVAELINVWAVGNFAGVWDDGVHNFYLYKRGSDGKYLVLPQDFDLYFGGDGGNFAQPPNGTIFLGEEGTGQDPAGGFNGLKSAVLKAFRTEFRARFVELLGTALEQKNVVKLLEEAQADWDRKAWDESPAQGKCDAPGRIVDARNWLAARYVALAQQGIK